MDSVRQLKIMSQNDFSQAMEILVKHPSKIFDVQKVKTIFLEACYRGNEKVVKILLQHPQVEEILHEKDNIGTGNF